MNSPQLLLEVWAGSVTGSRRVTAAKNSCWEFQRGLLSENRRQHTDSENAALVLLERAVFQSAEQRVTFPAAHTCGTQISVGRKLTKLKAQRLVSN